MRTVKNSVYIFLLGLITFGFVTDNPSDYMKFDKFTHDFGNIAQNIPVEATFIITNIGNAPLIINTVEKQCGCTTPRYSPAPILPQQSDTLLVGYNAAAMGSFTKKITVKTNFGNQDLYIRGTVVEQ